MHSHEKSFTATIIKLFQLHDRAPVVKQHPGDSVHDAGLFRTIQCQNQIGGFSTQ